MKITKDDIDAVLKAHLNWKENGPSVTDLLLDMRLKLKEN